jgi:hypothetical protein
MKTEQKAVTGSGKAPSEMKWAHQRGGKTVLSDKREDRVFAKSGKAPSVIEYDLPAYWASYLINGDDSGIEGKDQYEADKFLAERNLPSPVSCEPAGIGRFNGVMCDLETYSFLV